MDVIKRRLELLKLESEGLCQAEIVKQLKNEMHCSERTVYNDFETRASWQPTLQSLAKPDHLLLKIMNRYDHVYRLAAELFKASSNPLVKLGSLNTMLKATSSMRDTVGVSNLWFAMNARLSEDKRLEVDEKVSLTTPFETNPELKEAWLESAAEQKIEACSHFPISCCMGRNETAPY